MPTTHDHGEGLHEDLARLATRRDALRIFGAGSAAAILATLGTTNKPTGTVPSETAGPYPGDGSNGPDVLDDSGIVRHDIRRSFGDSRTLAKGVPLRVNLTVTDAAKDYAPLSGLAVYEVYSSVAKAVANGPIVKTSQIALPQAACRKVYAAGGYTGRPLADLALDRHGLQRRQGDPPARHRHRQRQQGVRGEPDDRHLGCGG